MSPQISYAGSEGAGDMFNCRDILWSFKCMFAWSCVKVWPCWLRAVIELVYLKWEGWHSTPVCLFGYELFFFRATTACLRNAQYLSHSLSLCICVCVCVLRRVESRVQRKELWRCFKSKITKSQSFQLKSVAGTNSIWLSIYEAFSIYYFCWDGFTPFNNH